MIALAAPAWVLVAACCAAAAVWWLPAPHTAPVRLQDVRAGTPHSDDWEPSGTLVIALVVAALEQGASIPTALRTVGACCGPACASALADVADSLEQGVPWGDAWSVADEPGTRGLAAVLHTLADALRSPWQDGSAAVPRLRAAAEQLDSLERMHIERTASALSVRLLLPMGLCFLPAFLCIAVVPTIMSFLRG